MNHLIAKVKGKQGENYKNVLAGAQVYRIPENLENAKSYTPAYHLEEDEWFVIAEFSKEEFCIDLLKETFRSTAYSMLDRANPDNIEYICSYQNGDEFYFQRIFKHSLLKRKLVSLGDEIKLEEGKRRIVINEESDALYIKSKDCLYFKKLETIVPIFNGIEMLYREATNEETEQFLNSDFIETVDYGVQDVGKANRKRIAMAMNTMEGFSKKQKKRILAYTHEYYPDLKYEDEKFSITSNDDLKFLLWGIEQRYYTTPVTEEKRVANSVISLSGVEKGK